MTARPNRPDRPRRATQADAFRLDEAECLLAETEGIEVAYEARRLAAANRRRWFKERGLRLVAGCPRKPCGPR
jgi:hypothetical protein